MTLKDHPTLARRCPRCSTEGRSVSGHVETEHGDCVPMGLIAVHDIDDLADMMACPTCNMVWFEFVNPEVG